MKEMSKHLEQMYLFKVKGKVVIWISNRKNTFLAFQLNRK